MNCNKCGCEFSIYGLKQHENVCSLTKEDVLIIRNDYVNNFLSLGEVVTKYQLSVSVASRILKNDMRSVSDGIKLSKKLKPYKHTEETKKKLSEWRKKYLKENPDKIKWIGNDSKPCRDFKKILLDNNINFVEEFKPIDGRFFSIDVAFPDRKIGIEINGEQHYERNKDLKKYYQDRHDLIEKNGWKLYEVYTSLIYKSEFIENFILELKNNYNIENIDYSFYRKENVINRCECGNEILKYSEICIKCRNKKLTNSLRKVERPKYEMLINDTKELGFLATGKKYGVSDNTIRKWIKMYEKYGLDI